MPACINRFHLSIAFCYPGVEPATASHYGWITTWTRRPLYPLAYKTTSVTAPGLCIGIDTPSKGCSSSRPILVLRGKILRIWNLKWPLTQRTAACILSLAWREIKSPRMDQLFLQPLMETVLKESRFMKEGLSLPSMRVKSLYICQQSWTETYMEVCASAIDLWRTSQAVACICTGPLYASNLEQQPPSPTWRLCSG